MRIQWRKSLKDLISFLSHCLNLQELTRRTESLLSVLVCRASSGTISDHSRTEFLRNDSAVLDAWIFVIIGLFIITATFVLIVPILNQIAYLSIEGGAPYTQINFIRKMMAWGLGTMGVGLVVYGIMRSYKQTYDQGIYERRL